MGIFERFNAYRADRKRGDGGTDPVVSEPEAPDPRNRLNLSNQPKTSRLKASRPARQVCCPQARRIAANMEASLGSPTATSVRTVPAKLLQVNRQLLNQHLTRTSGTKGELHPPDRLRGRQGARSQPA